MSTISFILNYGQTLLSLHNTKGLLSVGYNLQYSKYPVYEPVTLLSTSVTVIFGGHSLLLWGAALSIEQ